MIREQFPASRVAATTPVFVAALFEAITEQVVELAGHRSKLAERKLISLNDVAAVLADPTSPLHGILTHHVATSEPSKVSAKRKTPKAEKNN